MEKTDWIADRRQSDFPLKPDINIVTNFSQKYNRQFNALLQTYYNTRKTVYSHWKRTIRYNIYVRFKGKSDCLRTVRQ